MSVIKRIKVLEVAASLKIGGAEKVARDIAFYADAEQYEFHYIVFGDEVGAFEPELLEKGCQIFHLKPPSQSYFGYLLTLRKLIEENRYDVVHAHNMFNCGLTMLAAANMGVSVRIAHAHSALNNGNGRIKQVYERTMRYLILHCATDLVACGIAAGNRLFGAKAFEQRGTLILNGIDIPAFAYDEEKREAIRSKFNLKGKFVLGHVGHLAKVKNQSFLLDLMPYVLAKQPDAILLLLGEGEDRVKLETKICRMHLENQVIMTGNVSNVSDYLSAMDVFVFPSLYEGLPLSILEVQANGLPCVISDGVPKDVFLTDLIHPLSLNEPKQQWTDAIFTVRRKDAVHYNQQLQGSDFSVETAMGKICRIYDKG